MSKGNNNKIIIIQKKRSSDRPICDRTQYTNRFKIPKSGRRRRRRTFFFFCINNHNSTYRVFFFSLLSVSTTIVWDIIENRTTMGGDLYRGGGRKSSIVSRELGGDILLYI